MMFLGKQINMDFLENADKQTKRVKFGTSASLRPRVENPTSRLAYIVLSVNFARIKKFVCENSNEF